MTAHPVSFNELLKVLESQGITEKDILPGDVVLIRFGYISQYEGMSEDTRARLDGLYRKQKPENIGIEPSAEFLKFLWDKKIAAVAGDNRSFEVWPCSQLQWHLHEWLLAGWGMPIGELFNLENLSKACKEANRYTFFFTSSPMNVRMIHCAIPARE
jgi:kynurenine formamidase